jgi:hypothetical protein
VGEIKLAKFPSSVDHLPHSAPVRVCVSDTGVSSIYITRACCIVTKLLLFNAFNFFSGCQAQKCENRWSKAIMILALGIKRKLTSLPFRS